MKVVSKIMAADPAYAISVQSGVQNLYRPLPQKFEMIRQLNAWPEPFCSLLKK